MIAALQPRREETAHGLDLGRLHDRRAALGTENLCERWRR